MSKYKEQFPELTQFSIDGFESGMAETEDMGYYWHEDVHSVIDKLQAELALEKQKCKEIVEHTCSIHDETGWVCSVYRERNRYETAIKKAIGTLDSADIGTKKILEQALKGKAATPQENE